MYKEIYDMYATLALGSNNICKECSCDAWWDQDSNGRIGPVPIYYIGEKYIEQKTKIVFVASAGYGWDDILPAQTVDYQSISPIQRQNLINSMEKSHHYLLQSSNISIYNVLRQFIINYYGSEEYSSSICLTNLIHCNKGNVEYDFPAHIRKCCAHQQGNLFVTKREIDILKPDIIIGLCTKKDKFYIEEWTFDYPVKKICLGHPSRKNIGNYVSQIIEAINGTAL